MIKLVSGNKKIDNLNYDSFYNEFDNTNNSIERFYSFLIKNDKDIIGYASLIFENNDYRLLFLDVKLKNEYQDITEEVLKKIEKLNIPQYIIIETSINNIKAINSLKNKIRIKVIDDKAFYLLQNKRYEEFLVFDGVRNIEEHYNDKDKIRGCTINT